MVRNATRSMKVAMKGQHRKARGSFAWCLPRLFRDDKGAISGELETLTSAVVGLGIATTASVSSGLVSLSGDVEEALKGDSIILTSIDASLSSVGGHQPPSAGRGLSQGFQWRKLPMILRPTRWLFSGWNWVPKMLSRPTEAVIGPPWSVTARR